MFLGYFTPSGTRKFRTLILVRVPYRLLVFTSLVNFLTILLGSSIQQQWTPDGDAFIIGPDLSRLESETLPQFFRHNRFQSLVRQLNFYSFRKVNRERSMWVYKHDLFQRDNPENLVLLRRRACPTSDGRRQRPPLEKLSRQLSVETLKSDDDSTASFAVGVATKQPVTVSGAKRQILSPSKLSDQPVAKRPALVWSSPDLTGYDEGAFDVDTSMMQAVPLTESEDSDDQASSSKIDEKTEMEEQSVIVSEVASQLAQYARKAMLRRRGARSRRSGIVTPSFGSSRSFILSSGNLLTYDDECHDGADLSETRARSHVFNRVGIPKSDVRDKRGNPEVFKQDLVVTRSHAEGIVKRLLVSIAKQDWYSLAVAANVALFCMVTCPLHEKSLCNGISELFASCDRLAVEFKLYNAALQPSENLVNLQQIWEHEGSRCDAVRAFRIFAVNSMQKLLDKASLSDNLPSDDDFATLEHTAAMWQMSVGLTA